MSRIGKKLITIPSGVTVDLNPAEIKVKGPKGQVVFSTHPRVSINKTAEGLTVGVLNDLVKKDRSLWGTYGSIIKNMIDGVTLGFKRQLEINGVGYKATLKGKNLVLEVGFSHPVEITPVPNVSFAVEKNIITVEGIDKQVVGEMAAQIRAVRKPEPYKGKGIKYVEEVLRRKAGKTATKAAS